LVNQSKHTVAIFGGSFDPPHIGHQHIVETIVKHLDIDKLLVVPAYLNPFKSFSFASAPQRLSWCRTLFSTQHKVIVSDYEINEGKSTTTKQTVEHFNTLYDVKYLVIGSDNLLALTKWHNFSWLNETIIWVIITREGYPLNVKNLRKWQILEVNAHISSTQIRNKKDLQYVDTKIQKSVQTILKGSNP